MAAQVILGKELGLIDWNPRLLLCFEFCDLLVSITVFVYVANTAISSFTMHIAQRDWDRIAMTPTSVIIADVKFYLESLKKSRWKRFKHWMPFVASSWRNDADFKILALLFKTKFHLESNFDYVMYVKQVLEDVVVSTANLSTCALRRSVPLPAFDHCVRFADPECTARLCATDHWAIIMAINGLWYVAMVYVMPQFDLIATDASVTCPFCLNPGASADAGTATNRRQLGAAAAPEVCRAKLLDDECGMNATDLEVAALKLADVNDTASYWAQCSACAGDVSDAGDIEADDTLVYTLLFVAIGWIVVLNQALIVLDLARRMRLILTFSGAHEGDEAVPDLLEQLQKQLLPQNKAAAMRAALEDKAKAMRSIMRTGSDDKLQEEDDEQGDDEVNIAEAGDLHYRNLVSLDVEEHEMLADHVMVFHVETGSARRVGETREKTSNDVLSLKTFDALMFVSMSWQLIVDFYFSFYWVHMAQRVPKAFGREGIADGDGVKQLMLHAAIVAPVVMTLYLLMITTRQIALLKGVLHLDEDSVGSVLTHMDRVASIRRRIRDTLANMKGKKHKKDVKSAKAMLTKVELGELAVLQQLAQRKMTERITRQEVADILNSNENLSINKKSLNRFLDRDSAKAFELKSRAEQATALTATTLKIAGSGDADDTIEMWEFSKLVVRKAAEKLLHATEMCAPPEDVKALRAKITALDSVDDEMIDYSERLSQDKSLFKETDKDGSGGVSRNELYGALKRFRVPITKPDFKAIFRVIDPDQSNTMSMSEWVDFMMASDADFEVCSQTPKIQRSVGCVGTCREDAFSTSCVWQSRCKFDVHVCLCVW